MSLKEGVLFWIEVEKILRWTKPKGAEAFIPFSLVPLSSSSGGASLSSATSLGAWSAVATFPNQSVKTSSGSDSFYDERE